MAYKKNIFKDKTVVTLSAISIIAAAALIGGIALDSKGQNNDDKQEIVDLNESDTTKSLADISDDNEIISENETSSLSEIEEMSETTEMPNQLADDSVYNTDNTNSTEVPSEMAEQNASTSDEDEISVNAQIDNSGFNLNSLLTWPVDGNIIIDYDMENTVYFPTLNLYKCSDAICIQSEVGTPVYASAKCTVTKVASNEEIGSYVMVDLGNEYQLVYGQLKDIVVNMDDTLESGDLIGYVNEPSSYYSVEGPNLYLKLTENGNPINPLDYLNYE